MHFQQHYIHKQSVTWLPDGCLNAFPSCRVMLIRQPCSNDCILRLHSQHCEQMTPLLTHNQKSYPVTLTIVSCTYLAADETLPRPPVCNQIPAATSILSKQSRLLWHISLASIWHAQPFIVNKCHISNRALCYESLGFPVGNLKNIH